MTDDAASMDIERLIPQRLPMRIAESVACVDDISIVVTATVRATWPTARDGCARTLMLVELVAQASAALQGWKERHEKDGTGGLLVGIHSATPRAATIPVGTSLTCSVRITHGAPNYLAFDGEVADDQGTLWMTASIQAYRPEASDPAGASP